MNKLSWVERALAEVHHHEKYSGKTDSSSIKYLMEDIVESKKHPERFVFANDQDEALEILESFTIRKFNIKFIKTC